MSSKHFKVFLANNEAFIEDNSSNGTIVNHVKLKKNVPELLRNGSSVTFFDPNPEKGGSFFI